MAKRVYLFNEGQKEDRDLLGGKGANLCEMTNLGLPVPFGFIITTNTCREYFENGNKLPNRLEQEYRVALDLVEQKMGCDFGDSKNPLLLCPFRRPRIDARHDGYCAELRPKR